MINVFIAVRVQDYDGRADRDAPGRVRKALRETGSEDPQLARKRVAGRCLQSVYVDTEDEIEQLRAGGAVILGAWDWEGRQVVKPHPSLRRYMPPRMEQDGDKSVEIDDEQIRDVNLRFGQKERDFG